ncbi:MAG: SCP2 sterol-binding domain-containing protein [Candidatus Dormibacteraeota bacterium]|nr:SCP2 sterol-binding domain-containing protein [Candidatus Dormibacteraeota bacterium]
MSSPASVDPADVHAALADVASRLCALVRSIEDPAAHAIGNWNTVEVAVHVAHVWENLTALADDEIPSPLQDIHALGPLTQDLVRQDGDRIPAALADRIDVRATAFLSDASRLHSEVRSPWLVQGITVPRVALACHLLSESLLHGHDIARAQQVRWDITRAHAGLALMGFAFPLLSRLDPRAMVDQERARGMHARYDISLRGAGHVFMEIADGAVTVQLKHARSVDCHLSADPATFLLLLFGRISQWPPTLTGRLVAWGRKPWLASKLRQVLRNP